MLNNTISIILGLTLMGCSTLGSMFKQQDDSCKKMAATYGFIELLKERGTDKYVFNHVTCEMIPEPIDAGVNECGNRSYILGEYNPNTRHIKVANRDVVNKFSGTTGDTVIHEFCHAIGHLRDGTNGHDENWAKCMREHGYYFQARTHINYLTKGCEG